MPIVAVSGTTPMGGEIGVQHDPIGGIVRIHSWGENGHWAEVRYHMFQDERVDALNKLHADEMAQLKNGFDTLKKRHWKLSVAGRCTRCDHSFSNCKCGDNYCDNYTGHRPMTR